MRAPDAMTSLLYQHIEASPFKDSRDKGTFIVRLYGNCYLTPMFDLNHGLAIADLLQNFGIEFAHGLWLCPTDIQNNLFAGLTVEGMQIWPLEKFKQMQADCWKHIIKKWEPDVPERMWSSLDRSSLEASLLPHGGIDFLAEPSSWKILGSCVFLKDDQAKCEFYLLE